MAKDAQINIAVEQSQKEKWQEHAADNDQYRDLTNLIEQSVEDRISTDTEEFSPEEAILQISSEIQNLETKLSDIKQLNEKIDDTQATSMELEETADDIISYFKSRE